MSEKPTQADYEAMLALIAGEMDALHEWRDDIADKGEPTDWIDLSIQRWEEIRKCVEACKVVDRLTRVEVPT